MKSHYDHFALLIGVALLTASYFLFAALPVAGQTVPPQVLSRPPVRPVDLEHAIGYESAAALRALLDRSDTAYTPADISAGMVLATACRSLEKVRMLIDRGADVNAVNRFKQSALMLAAQNDDTDFVKLLLAHGANVKARNERGETAVSYAAGHMAVMQLLLNSGAQASQADLKPGLILAVRKGNLMGATYFLNHGADPNTRDNFVRCSAGMTPQQRRNYRGPSVLALAEQRLARTMDEHNTAHIANAKKIVKLLREAGAKRITPAESR